MAGSQRPTKIEEYSREAVKHGLDICAYESGPYEGDYYIIDLSTGGVVWGYEAHGGLDLEGVRAYLYD